MRTYQNVGTLANELQTVFTSDVELPRGVYCMSSLGNNVYRLLDAGATTIAEFTSTDSIPLGLVKLVEVV